MLPLSQVGSRLSLATLLELTRTLVQAIQTKPTYVRHGNSADPARRSPPSHVYDADISPTWTVGSVAHGGYLLSLLTDTVQQHQHLQSSSHLDPAHLTSHFLSATLPGKAQVEVKEMSITKRWTRLDVELWQWTPDPNTQNFVDPKAERVLRIQAHFLVTTLPDLPAHGDEALVTKEHVNYLDAPCPLLEHPGSLDMSDGGTPVPPKLRFNNAVKWKEVKHVEPNDGSLAWGAWMDLTSEQDLTGTAALMPFFADVAKNGPETLPRDRRPGLSWFPTMTLSLDFKGKFPLLSPSPSSSSGLAKRTVGLYSKTRTIHEGRHDLTVEVWSAPAELGSGAQRDGEREKDANGVEVWRKSGSRLLGVSTQMALTVPLEFNLSKGRPKEEADGAPEKRAKL
ncbi:hypothetical protein JCM8097_009582 [Rhodosporidiobolus ruineniae]